MNQVSKVYFGLFLLIVLMMTIIMYVNVGSSGGSDLHMQCACINNEQITV